MIVPRSRFRIAMTEEETGDGVTDARLRVVLAEVIDSAAATLGRTRRSVKNTVAHLMTEQRADQPRVDPPSRCWSGRSAHV